MTMKRAEMMKKIRALGKVSKDQRNSIVCILIGHSRIQSTCFGYYNCARCDSQVGDSLGGAYSAEKVVIVGHDCKTCRANYKGCTWQDKLYVPNPFKVERRR